MADLDEVALPTSCLGAFLFGGLISAGLFALTTVQSGRLVQSESFLRWTFWRVAVPFLWLIDTAHFSLFAYNLFALLAERSTVHVVSRHTLAVQLMITIIRDSLIRAALSYRIYLLSGERRLPHLLLAILSSAIFGLGTGIVIQSLPNNRVFDFSSYAGLAIAYLVLVILFDGTAAVCFYMYSQEYDESPMGSGTFLSTVVPRNIVSTIVGWAPLITVAALPQTLVFFGLHCGVASFSFLGLLTSLNNETRNEDSGRLDMSAHQPLVQVSSRPPVIEKPLPLEPETPITASAFLYMFRQEQPEESAASASASCSVECSMDSHRTYMSIPVSSPLPSPMPRIQSMGAESSTFNLRHQASRSVQSVHIPSPRESVGLVAKMSRKTKSLCLPNSRAAAASAEARGQRVSIYDPELGEGYDPFNAQQELFGPFRLSHVGNPPRSPTESQSVHSASVASVHAI